MNKESMFTRFVTALYCRLSIEDGRDNESMSIINQKALPRDFARKIGFLDYEYYVDDRYAGRNFNRPFPEDDCRHRGRQLHRGFLSPIGDGHYSLQEYSERPLQPGYFQENVAELDGGLTHQREQTDNKARIQAIMDELRRASSVDSDMRRFIGEI